MIIKQHNTKKFPLKILEPINFAHGKNFTVKIFHDVDTADIHYFFNVQHSVDHFINIQLTSSEDCYIKIQHPQMMWSVKHQGASLCNSERLPTVTMIAIDWRYKVIQWRVGLSKTGGSSITEEWIVWEGKMKENPKNKCLITAWENRVKET